MDEQSNTEFEDSSLTSPTGRKAAPLGKSFRSAIKILLSTGAFSLFFLIVMTVIRGLLPGLQVFAIGALVTSVSLSQGGWSPNGTLALVLLSITLLLAYALDNLMKYVSDSLTLRLSYNTDIQVTDKLCKLEVQDFESADTYDTIQRVDSATGEHIF